jgi:hypothetical protein
MTRFNQQEMWNITKGEQLYVIQNEPFRNIKEQIKFKIQ